MLTAAQIEGQMNECIVATALYYLDSEHLTPRRLSFRMMTDSTQAEMEDQVGQDMYKVYERIYGTRLGGDQEGRETVQTCGSVETPEGRLLAFPNIFLKNRNKPGHRRFIALWLVDPLRRIVSTANVPPQQFDWWIKAVFGTEAKTLGNMPPGVFQLLLEQELLLQSGMKSRLPSEVMDMVRSQVAPDGLMTVERARRHRLTVMEERSAFATTAREEEWANR
ncbi:hypothetical protein MYCTH_2133830 [Thermothelomyces thermophilus ATCC 42464]|uniref:DUF4246 domain-containing protein n=1 Tax=Thermothelomyces thermophilus (strain ATCC 42464 / BCRC 31852 / DSM 1799) TaxID=573729 RepID=G2QCE3_THET4|nr:uncharacterized protein MYCTH_2133830 [Thermothelomyces thermophilus ATCC 42464]AEO57318.1 hypothetical protein MYCTH_2133830 [Thermothelomyces thermophilus ATCC 42464]